METSVLRFGPYEIDTGTLELRREGLVIPLEPLPSRILARLAQDLDEMVPREELLRLGWPETPWVAEQSLNTCVYQIRRALSGGGDPAVELTTLRGRGYRLAVLPGQRRGTRWWRVAAAVLVIGGAAGTGFVVAGKGDPPPEVGRILDQARYLAFETQDLGAARALLDSGRTAMPDVAALHGQWGEVSLMLGDRAGARRGAARALALDDAEPSALRTRGLLAMLEGDWATAEASLAAALDRPPTDAPTLTTLAYLRAIQGRGDDADHLLRQALRHDALSATIHQDAGMIFLLLGRFAPAERACKDVLRFRPASGWAADCLFDITVLTGRTSDAAEWGRRLLALNEVAVSDGLPPGEVVARTEAWRLEAWEAAVEDGAYPLGLAYAYASNGRVEAAVDALRSAAARPRLGLLAVGVDPRLAVLRGDRAFEELRTELALPGAGPGGPDVTGHPAATAEERDDSGLEHAEPGPTGSPTPLRRQPPLALPAPLRAGVDRPVRSGSSTVPHRSGPQGMGPDTLRSQV